MKCGTHHGTNLPPRKCLPLYPFTPCLGAVRLTNTSGIKTSSILFPSAFATSRSTGPSSTSHPDGMSTLTIGSLLLAINVSTSSNGGRTGPENENPKIASRITSVSLRLPWSCWIVERDGIERFSVCCWSRFNQLLRVLTRSICKQGALPCICPWSPAVIGYYILCAITSVDTHLGHEYSRFIAKHT
jgi:hypothetical protein